MKITKLHWYEQKTVPALYLFQLLTFSVIPCHLKISFYFLPCAAAFFILSPVGVWSRLVVPCITNCSCDQTQKRTQRAERVIAVRDRVEFSLSPPLCSSQIDCAAATSLGRCEWWRTYSTPFSKDGRVSYIHNSWMTAAAHCYATSPSVGNSEDRNLVEKGKSKQQRSCIHKCGLSLLYMSLKT